MQTTKEQIAELGRLLSSNYGDRLGWQEFYDKATRAMPSILADLKQLAKLEAAAKSACAAMSITYAHDGPARAGADDVEVAFGGAMASAYRELRDALGGGK